MMGFNKTLKESALKVLLLALGIPLLVVLLVGIYMGGYYKGASDTLNQIASVTEEKVEATASPTTTPLPNSQTQIRPRITWGGPDLWEAVNKRRLEFGVNALGTRSELCTIASIRLNEILDLGTLDGHEGFSNMPERRPDLKWIFEKYNISEFLVAGATSPQDAVSLWENTLGHKKLLDGGEYVWGCIYAQEGFGVAIAAF